MFETTNSIRPDLVATLTSVLHEASQNNSTISLVSNTIFFERFDVAIYLKIPSLTNFIIIIKRNCIWACAQNKFP